jgi:hypothetical protein
VKQFLDLEPSIRQALAMMMRKERVKHLPVRGQSVRPEFLPHEASNCSELFLNEWH